MPCNPVGRDSEVHASPAHGSFCASVRRRKCSHRGGSGREEAATYRAQVPLRISRRRGQVGAVEAKVGPRGRIGRNGAAVCRVPCGRARTRHAFWTVLCVVIVVLLPVIFSVSVLSVCLVLSLRVSDPWEPERLFASVPRAFRAPLLLAQRAGVVPYQNAECTTRERICRASNSLEVGRLVEPTWPFKKVHPGPRRGFSLAWLHGCVAACAAGLHNVQRSPICQ